ncbi:retrograde regulation protein 2 [Lecanora helva]
MAANQHYYGLVDIGSNGIRFSISDLSPTTARNLPVIFQDRSGISLYDAQHSTEIRTPIPSDVITEVISALRRFKTICQDFGVQNDRITIVATEATRNAANRDDFLRDIKRTTGWGVRLLAKEEEGRLGALGIASSNAHVNGICLDMGGGSVQLTWVATNSNELIDMGPSVSLPYGAAALMSRFSTATSVEEQDINTEIASKVQHALEEDLQIPAEHWKMAKDTGGFDLYLSGGGFRGWGYILMSQDSVQPYPIPVINGYTVSESRFYSALEVNSTTPSVFRISSRRASQVPAVKAVVKALKAVQLPISQVTFVQGGVREGLLYSDLPDATRIQDPLIASTSPYAPPSAAKLTQLLCGAVPISQGKLALQAAVNLLYVHGPLPKDIRAAAALRCTTTGILAGTHGLSHGDRWILALILCERWGGDLTGGDIPFLQSLETLSGSFSWWTKLIGRLAGGIADLFPAGIVRDNEQIIDIQSGFPEGENEWSADSFWIKITVFQEIFIHSVKAWAKHLEKHGKKKNSRGGMKIEVTVTLADQSVLREG